MQNRGFIVVADDDQAIAQMVCDLLAEEGFEALACGSAALALRAIERRTPDLVILDLQMERADSGLQVIEQMRLRAPTAATPVILYSADARVLQQKRELLRQQGCAILEKPFSLRALLAMIEAQLGPPRSRALGDAPPEA